MFKELLKQIKAYKHIYIFKHLEPDTDAFCSAYALKLFIENNFKDKHVELMGTLPSSFENNIFIENSSLAIVVDTAVKKRIDGDVDKCSFVINIDHHYSNEDFGDLNIKDITCVSTTELLSKIFYSRKFIKFKLTKEMLEHLYSGIIADSNSFQNSGTTHKTLKMAAKIAEDGDLNIFELNQNIIKENSSLFKAKAKIKESLKVDSKVAYIIVKKRAVRKLNVDFKKLQWTVDDLRIINDINFWAIFVYSPETKLFEGSIRCLQEFDINEICQKYNGGGQKNLCAVHRLTYKECLKLIEELKQISK